jgi:hypothetical protein
MVVHGGNDSLRPTRLLARLDVDAATWTDLKPSLEGGEAPTARSGHCGLMLGTRLLLWGGFGSRGFLDDLHAFDTAPDALIEVRIEPGDGTHCDVHRVQVVFHGLQPPPLHMQWYRRRRTCPREATLPNVPGPWERVLGANAMAYLPNADDIGQVMGCCVLPCKGHNPLGPSYMAVSSTAVTVDPELGELVRGLVTNTFAEFDVRLLGANGTGAPHTLQFSRDKVALRQGGREGPVLLREGYRTDFKVLLSGARMNTLVLQLGEGEALPLAVDAVHERDLIALVARSFWALAVKGRTTAAGGGGRGGGESQRGGEIYAQTGRGGGEGGSGEGEGSTGEGGRGGRVRGGGRETPTVPWTTNPPTSKLLRDYNYSDP